MKYEMLRLVSVEKRPVSEAAKLCGFSRPSFYQAQAAFAQSGLAGLIPQKPGPRSGHKLTADGDGVPDRGARRRALAATRTIGEFGQEELRGAGSPAQHRTAVSAPKKTAVIPSPPSLRRAPRNNGLIARYEELRQQALGRPDGITRGKAWRCSCAVACRVDAGMGPVRGGGTGATEGTPGDG